MKPETGVIWKVVIAILVIGLFLLIARYFSVFINGYDIFEGINDPRANVIDYLTYGAAGFVAAGYWGLKRGALVGALMAVAGVVISWSLIVGAWVSVSGGRDIVLSQW